MNDKMSATEQYVLTVSELSNSFNEITNQDFLREAFSVDLALQTSARPVLVSFRGSPSGAVNWGGIAYNGSNAPESTTANNYYSISTFRPEKDGSCRRRKSAFFTQFVIVFDDVTSKIIANKKKAQIPIDRIRVPPSFVIETSSENYQVGFFLKEPITDARIADSLSDAIIRAGLSDLGATGPTARLMRLPRGCPDKRYSMTDIIRGFDLVVGVRPAVSSTSCMSARSRVPAETEEKNAVFTPVPQINPVLQRLKERGLVKQKLGFGKYDITCPWAHQHTDQADTGAVY